PARPVPADVSSRVAALRAGGADVELLGASRAWPPGHYELKVGGVQNAYVFDGQRFTQTSNVRGAPAVLAPKPNEWADPARAVPEPISAGISELRARGLDVELVGASRHWPEGTLEVKVDGVQNAYQLEGQRLVQVSNLRDGYRTELSLERGKSLGLVVRPGDDLQAAVDRAPPGTRIELQPGRYRLDRELTLRRDDLAIEGSRAGAVELENRSPGIGVHVLAGVRGVHLANFHIDGGGGPRSGVFSEGHDGSITGVRSTNHGGHGLSLHNATGNVIEGCESANNAWVGISMYGSDRNTLRNNHTHDNGTEGITVDHGSDENLVANNRVVANRGGVGGIGVDWARGNTIEGNTIEHNGGWAGITTQNNEGSSTGNVFRNNTIVHDRGPGIWLTHQLYPSQAPEWNSTGNRGATPSNANRVEGNTITAGGRGFLVVDGSSGEALERGDRLDARVVHADGRVTDEGAGTRNVGNQLDGNRAR
ncbi:right-handed parallel beta-helix repeat-containing protein, partial [Myxococcota bacterium]|nr:right-handed parallel beta-helix repeat-containing protein [Myxococcota bacterium]